MKKLLTTLATLAVGLQLSAAQAAPISIDVSSFFGQAAGTQKTSFFDYLTLASFRPLSTYTDLTNNGITTGDLVTDTGTTTVNSLNPLGFGDNTAGFNATWGMRVDWKLNGIAIVQGSNYVGAFNSGEVKFSLIKAGNIVEQALKIMITGSSLEEITQGASSVGISVFGKVVEARANTFFDQWGQDFANLLSNDIKINGLGTSNILNLNNAPTKIGTNALGQDIYTRTTTLNSVDVSFSVSEPSSLAVFGLALLGFGVAARRKAQK